MNLHTRSSPLAKDLVFVVARRSSSHELAKISIVRQRALLGLVLRLLFSFLLFFRGLFLLSLRGGLTKFVSEAKLAHTVGIRHHTFGATHFRLHFEGVILQVLLARGNLSRLLLLRLLEVAEGRLRQHEVSLVWVVLDWASQNHVALLEMV